MITEELEGAIAAARSYDHKSNTHGWETLNEGEQTAVLLLAHIESLQRVAKNLSRMLEGSEPYAED